MQKAFGVFFSASRRGEVSTVVAHAGVPSMYYQMEGSKMVAVISIQGAAHCVEELLGWSFTQMNV